jgi:hypothetical protein
MIANTTKNQRDFKNAQIISKIRVIDIKTGYAKPKKGIAQNVEG